MSKAVMKQAMDALKYNQSNWYGKREAVAALETELAKPQHPDLRKAAEMALEALKAWDALIKYQYGGSSEAMTAMQNVAWRTLDTIEGLETALAQTEQQPVAWMMPDYGDVLSASEADGTGIYNIPLYTAPQKYCPSENNAAYEKGFVEGMAKQAQSSVDRAVNAMAGEYVDTAGTEHQFKYVAYGLRADENGKLSIGELPKREWQGLTDEEISEVLGSDIYQEYSGELKFIRAIEAKIKDKNERN